MNIKTVFILLLVFFTHSFAVTSYEIEVSYNDDFFIINGEKYEAKTYCFNMHEGDKVVFVEGSPYGVCVSAKLLNLRSEKICNVWCE